MRGSRAVVYRRGDIEIPLELIRSRRRTVGITVRPGGQVCVRAPRSLPEPRVMDSIAGREAWLIRQRRRMEAIAPYPAPDWQDATRLPLRGDWVTLRFHNAPAEAGSRGRDRVRLSGAELLLGPSRSGAPWPPGPASVHRLVSRWYRDYALRVFSERLQTLRRERRIAALGRPGDLAVRRMRRRWGSCFRDGRITLNTELVAQSDELIDYVLVHELCHLQVFNHGPRFYAALDGCMPDWRERRERLHAARTPGFLSPPG